MVSNNLYAAPDRSAPGPVENLKVAVNPNVPSVTLTWNAPGPVENLKVAVNPMSYEVRFRPRLSQQYKELPPVDCHCRDITLGRERLKPLTTYDFEVRAVSSDGAGPWTAVTQYFCKQFVAIQL